MMNKTAIVSLFSILLTILYSTSVNGHTHSLLETPLKLGNGAINSVTWSPDGQQVAIGSSYGTWIYNGELRNPEQILNQETNSVSWSPDSKTLTLSVTRYIDDKAEREIQIFDTETKNSFIVKGKSKASWNHDGNLIAIYSNKSIEIRDVLEREIINHYSGDNEDLFIQDLQWASQSNKILLSAKSKTYLWNIDTNRMELLTYVHQDSLSWKDRDSEIVGVNNSEVTIWNSNSLEVAKTIHWSIDSYYASISPDGTKVSASFDNDELHVLDTRTEEIVSMSGGGKRSTEAHWSKDGTYIAIEAVEGFVRVWNSNDYTMISDWKHQSVAGGEIYWHPNKAQFIYVTGSDLVQLWNIEGQSLDTLHSYMGDISQMLWGRNEYQLLVNDRYKTRTQVWDVRTGELIIGSADFLDDEVPLAWYQSNPNFQFNAKPYVAWTADGSRFVAITEGGTIRISEIGELPLQVRANMLSWSRSGELLTINYDCDLQIWSVEEQEVVLHQEQTCLTSWNPISDTVAIASQDGLNVVDIMSETTQHLILPQDIPVARYVENIIWLSNGNAILLDMTVNGFGKQAIWDLQSGELVKVLDEDLTLVTAYNDQLAGVHHCCRETRGSTSTEIIVRAAFSESVTYQIELGNITGQLNSVQDLQWNSNGEYLAATVDQSEIYIWEH